MKSKLLLALCLLRVALSQVCTKESPGTCGSSYCDFPTIARPGCSFIWPSGAPMAFMCFATQSSGACRQCPVGWTASGAFCVECDPLKSCDRQGVTRCDGTCSPAKYPTCDAATSRVSCWPCSVDFQSLAASNRALTRGGVLDAPDVCGAYFQCLTGYYLNSNTQTGDLSCSPCEFPEPSQTGFSFFTRGNTFGDKFSCLYTQERPRLSRAQLGEYGSSVVRSCPVGRTSEPFMAVTEADCVPCPSLPVNGLFAQKVAQCVPACQEGYELRGDACFLSDLSKEDCDRDGYSVQDTLCIPSPLPWSSPANQPRSNVLVTVQTRADAWLSLDGGGEFRIIKSTKKLATQSSADFCANLRSSIPTAGYTQDKPLFTKACGDVEYHEPYLLTTGEKYLYIFLERTFGDTNRFVMWQMQKYAQVVNGSPAGNPGQVWQTFRLPGRVCSAVVAPGDFVYLTLCNSTMVLFAEQLDFMVQQPSAENPAFTIEGTQYVIGRKLGKLIGADESGNADGMRDQARFRGPLSLALASPSRLLLADYANCRVAEVVVDFPGSFLTRATTVAPSGCFQGAFPLPYPRNMVSVLGGAAVLFVTDNGLVQLDSGLRKYTAVLTADRLREVLDNVLWMFADQSGERLTLHNATHTAQITRQQLACPDGYRARRGGACSACSQGTFSNGLECVACSNPTCPVGYGVVSCNQTSDAYCKPCTGAASFSFRWGSRCEVIPTFPCPPGYFGLTDCYPCSSLPDSQLGEALCQCKGYALVDNKTCLIPFPRQPYPTWLAEVSCTYKDVNCSVYGCYLANVIPRQCLPCPLGTYTSDGLTCQACPGFRQPTPARDSCVCRPPSVVSSDGSSCTCPAGHAAGGPDGCIPCFPGTVKERPTVLPDNYAVLSTGQCHYCLPGYEPSGSDSVSCSVCAAGRYREGAMPACELCPDLPSFARDPSRSASCVACRPSCGAGEYWAPCPINSSYYACQPCASRSRFRVFVGSGNGCQWGCVSGFYEYNGDCFPCTSLDCPVGFQHTPCSAYEDSHCRVACYDPEKPKEHSVWGAGCTWKCEDNYVLKTKVYPGWTEQVCETPEELPWSIRR